MYFYRASAHFARAEFEQGIADFSRVIELDPGEAAAYYNRGLSYQELGDADKAEADFAKAKELGYEPDDE